MNITKLECPNCHAALDNDYGNAGTFFCKYCGQKIIVEEMQNAEYDLKIRKMEMDHEKEKMAMEQKNQNIKYAHENQQNNYRMKIYAICIGLIVLMMILPLSLLFFSGSGHRKRVRELRKVEKEVQEAIMNEDYDMAIIKVNQLRLDDNYSTSETESWDAKREEYLEFIHKKMSE